MRADLEYVLAQLRKELDAVNAAISSLERLERSGAPRLGRSKDLLGVGPTKGANRSYRTAANGQDS